MSEKKTMKDFLGDIDFEDVKKSAKLNIKPKVTFADLGIKHAKDLIVLSDYYKVIIPKKKAKGTNNLTMLDVEYQGMEHQFVAQAKSFRYQLAVCQAKLGMNPEIDSPKGMNIKVWKDWAETKDFGRTQVYLVENNEA